MTEHVSRTMKDVLDRNIAVLNDRDIEAYLTNQRPDVELLLPGGLVLKGREQVRQYTETVWAAFPDGTLTFGDQVFAEDAAATEVVFSGTQTGALPTPSGSIPPTGRRVTLRSASILRIEDGKVASEHVYLDQLELMTQLGVTPAAPGGPADS